MSLANQVVLVTGGARRLGRAISEALLAEGALVAVHHFKSTDADRAWLEAFADRALPVSADLCSPTETERLFATIAARWPRLDAVVCNAAMFEKTPFSDLSDDVWDKMLALNLTAPRRCMQLGVAMGAHAIVNVLDVAATQAWRGYAAYGVTKAGLLHLTKIWAKELRGRVRVNAVSPGLILPPSDAPAEEQRRLAQKNSGFPKGTPQDAASAVCFLLREPHLTGVCLPVDAGESL